MTAEQLIIGLALMAPPYYLDYLNVSAKGECHWLTLVALPLSMLAMKYV